MANECKHCVVTCMDFRIQQTVEKLRNTLGIQHGQYDFISIPGGAGSTGQLVDDVYLSTK